jgi:hypothetical protein
MLSKSKHRKDVHSRCAASGIPKILNKSTKQDTTHAIKEIEDDKVTSRK